MVEEQSTPQEQAAKARTGAPSRLVRVSEGRVLGGVCTGLGRYTGIDPVVFRVAFGILVLAHGQGLLLYIAAALFMPAEPHRPAMAEQLFRRRFDAPATLSILGALLCGLVALSILGTGVIGLLGGQASTDAIALITVFGLALLVAHNRGVDLASVARSFPERVQGHRPEEDEATPTGGPVSLDKLDGRGGPDEDARGRGGLPEGMIDLATLSTSRTSSTADAMADATSGATAAAPERCAPPWARPPHGGAVTAEVGHGRPALTSITLLVAMVAAAGLWPVAQTHPGPEQTMILLAVALAVVACGLVAGGWFRARGLATVGTVLTCALLTTSVAAEAPPDTRYGEVEWRPTDAASVQPDYTLGAGSGRLDLTRLPLRPGQRVTVNAKVTLGSLHVTLPPGARVEVDARVGLGDLEVAGRTISGPGARTQEVLEPEVTGVQNPPVISLRIRSRLGDVQVSRG